MPFDVHTVEMPDGAGPQRPDRLIIGSLLGQANAAGGAGAAVNVTISGLQLPNSYGVLVDPGQDATWFVSGKTNGGFTVTLNPRLAANALAGGTIDIFIFS